MSEKKAPVPANSNPLAVHDTVQDDLPELTSQALTTPNLAAAMVTHSFGQSMIGQSDRTALVKTISASSKAVVSGDLSAVEAMLCSQAIALNTIFGDLAVQANRNRSDYPLAFDRYMKVALKAQAQCRATLETLAAIKNPPVVYARQANVTAGPQQVNNYGSEPTPTPACGEKKQNAPNELMEGQNGGS